MGSTRNYLFFFELARGEHLIDVLRKMAFVWKSQECVGVCSMLQPATAVRDVARAMHAWDDVDLTCAARSLCYKTSSPASCLPRRGVEKHTTSEPALATRPPLLCCLRPHHARRAGPAGGPTAAASSHGRGEADERREAVPGDGAAAGGLLRHVHRLRRLPQARHEPLRPRRLPQPRRHRRHGPLRPHVREGSEAQDDAAHLPQDHGACRARACAGPEHVLPRREADLGDLRLGARQHPPGHHVPAGPRHAHGEAEAPESPQPSQGRRHGLHRRRRRADDPLPRPRRAVPVVHHGPPPRRRCCCGGREPEQRVLAQRHRHDHWQLPLLVWLLHPPVEHAAELPRGADAGDADLLPGLRAHRRRGAGGGAPRHERLGHRLRHPPLHRRLLRDRVLRRGLLRAGDRDAGARAGVRDGVPAPVHDHHHRPGLHHTQRGDHPGKCDWCRDHSGGALLPHLGQEQGPPQQRQAWRRGRRRRAAPDLASHGQRQARRARRRPPCRRRRRDTTAVCAQVRSLTTRIDDDLHS